MQFGQGAAAWKTSIHLVPTAPSDKTLEANAALATRPRYYQRPPAKKCCRRNSHAFSTNHRQANFLAASSKVLQIALV
jgi:hypothetical protein